MKVVSVVVFIFLGTITTNVLIDLMSGYRLSFAMSNLINPFWVIEPGEYVMLALLLFIIIGQQILFIIKNREENQNGSN
jgi:hypothetical protein